MQIATLFTADFLLVADLALDWQVLASIATGLSVGAAVWLLARVIVAPRKSFDGVSYEGMRRGEIRRSSATYSWLEPLVDELAPATVRPSSSPEEAHLKVIQAAGLAPPWTYREMKAVRNLEGVLLGVCAGLVALPFAGPIPALFAFFIIAAGYVMYSSTRLKEQAEKRKHAVLRRMPFAVDLMALVMEAGGTFDDALQSLLTESAEHPIGQEFAAIQRACKMGRSRREALVEYQSRLEQEDIREFVHAVNNGEEFGSPLAQILRTQADQMRLKRSQWAEKAAGSAEVQIVFPGMLIMVACLLVVAAPVVLRALEFL